MRITKSIRNVPLIEVNNFCILTGLSLDVDAECIELFHMDVKE